jgi:predicted membrane-bound spermidine synthase
VEKICCQNLSRRSDKQVEVKLIPKNSLVYLAILIVSAVVVCFEIVTTRISSVIFINNYAAIILSLAILGLGIGGIYSHYRLKFDEMDGILRVVSRTIILMGISFLCFIVTVIRLNIENPFIYLILLFLPFFLAGIVYSQMFKVFAKQSHLLYAFDLLGAALGSVMAIFLLNFSGAANGVLLLAVLILSSAVLLMKGRLKKQKQIGSCSILTLAAIFLIMNKSSDLLGRIPIGHFPEKDYYYVYPNAADISQIIDSRWSIYGRSDLVRYDDQDMVRQLFVDGAAGTQMYRFSGDVRNPDMLLYNLLINQAGSVPFLFLTENERNNMLVIGPGGGKEILLGLLAGVAQITGVEINPDFVNIVKTYKDFNGGIYTDFPNVQIDVAEGRHYIKKTVQHFDLIVMALPSTEQLQNIDNFAMSENYLLTVEALNDYFNILTPEGRLVFTVHNQWELLRLIVTAVNAFNRLGIGTGDILDHLLILEQDFAPTIVIKKNRFTDREISYLENRIRQIPAEFPRVTYLPRHLREAPDTPVNRLLKLIRSNPDEYQSYINRYKFNVSPCVDDNPYFYRISKAVPHEYLWLLIGVLLINLFVVALPLIGIKKRLKTNTMNRVEFSFMVFICIGLGFMILEVALFQKLILYLGSPTISLSILLGSLLVGMGLGSFLGRRIFTDHIGRRFKVISLLIVVSGTLLFVFYPMLLNHLLIYNQLFRSIICFIMMVPFGFLLGIPFPSAMQILSDDLKDTIPWMYGVNGTMSVLGSVLAVLISMTFGFTAAYFTGLLFYAVLLIIPLDSDPMGTASGQAG